MAAVSVDLDRLDRGTAIASPASPARFQGTGREVALTTSQGTSYRHDKDRSDSIDRATGSNNSAGPVASAQAQENQSAARHAIGLALLNLGKLDDAAEYLEQAAAVRRQLVAEDPARLEYQLDLAATMVGLAEDDRKAGRAERAREWWGRALPMLTQAVECRPTDRLAWQLLA